MPISLRHPHLISLLDAARDDVAGLFWYLMELADDETTGPVIDPAQYCPHDLSRDLVARGRLPVRECVRLGVALASALEYLHEQGLVHRDIKPSNVIFVNGEPKLADVGLVTLARSETGGARGSGVGTYGYAPLPPEPTGTRAADVYSLGKVLYEVSTGKDRNALPALPKTLLGHPEIDGFAELNRIFLEASEADPHRRPTAAQLHDGLQRLSRELASTSPSKPT